MKKENRLAKNILMPVGITLGLLVGASSCNNNSKIQEKTSTFQGYHNDIEEGRTILVFDDKVKELRETATPYLVVYAKKVKELRGDETADLIIYGDNGVDTLQIGKKYTVEYTPSRIRSSPGTLKDIKPDNKIN
jgi:hypothetical protein